MKKNYTRSESTLESPSTRWWESYLVRYFVGFIVGAICVCLIAIELNLISKLAAKFLSSINNTVKPDWTAVLISFAFLGMVYCYIASAPITVLHVGRYSRGFIDAHSRHFWLSWLALCFFKLFIDPNWLFPLQITTENILLGLVALIAIIWLPITKDYSGIDLPKEWEKDKSYRSWLQSKPYVLIAIQVFVWCLCIETIFTLIIRTIFPSLDNITIKFWLLGLPVFWIGLTQYAVLLRVLNDTSGLIAFYQNLFHARKQKDARDIRDSYTHLREHSNSVFIVVVELSLLACFIALHRSFSSKDFHAQQFVEFGQIVLFVLFAWMIPTVFMWARANAIERDFSEKPDTYLNSSPK